MILLAIETSCDETAAAVMNDKLVVLSHTVASSLTLHTSYGGIVPEIAARAQLAYILPVINRTITEASVQLSSMNAIAVSHGPGLIGSLLVGVETAKTLAFVYQKPVIPVNHVLAHMFANFIYPNQTVTWPRNQSKPTKRTQHSIVTFPAVSLVASGGHTELYLMRTPTDLLWLGGTLDDAAGEAFDKTARLVGLGHGGGPAIEVSASTYDPHHLSHTISLPRPLMHDDTYHFSFSGLKTAVLREITKHAHDGSLSETVIAEFCYEIQEAITDVLVAKTVRAARQYNVRSILLSGGVAANSRLREKFYSAIQPSDKLTIVVPPVELCTDNAAMIGAYAILRGKPMSWHEVTAQPSLSVESSTE